MYNKLLLAVDGSENSLRATEEAVKIAHLCTECSIDVVFVADHSKTKSEVLHAQGKEELNYERRKKILPVESNLQENKISYTLYMLHGDPGSIIVEHANNESIDMVILGSRGLNALQEMVLGSVSHKVMKGAESPVLIVK
ncbi:universal stress protein [Phocicoccus pinnipedialis]|uniref:Stress response protein NhaX n=1 Tax=Phocicoccus pinnipedialis TaxID=110845 RepID=A0A6V7RMP2_9BACL|nr:universal stress protein [Jeotgalicoccus pinnipedialis]MBP1940235.1 nucleotide-binding universal stress UspA family protein [Jeotgalicoccus pinnipedialis]CAD2079568.1 Stress response protein NhaX [Jeotgalicoccus pinnipedialis]